MNAIQSGLVLAARSISTSYRDVITADTLAAALRSGEAPRRFHPHLMALLDETPLPVLLKAVAEAATPAAPVQTIMDNLRHWASEWKTCRTSWQ